MPSMSKKIPRAILNLAFALFGISILLAVLGTFFTFSLFGNHPSIFTFLSALFMAGLASAAQFAILRDNAFQLLFGFSLMAIPLAFGGIVYFAANPWNQQLATQLSIVFMVGAIVGGLKS